MLRLLDIFLRKNSSPFISKLVRVRDSNVYILLVVTIKPYNFYSWHFLLRPLLSDIFAGPFHRAKTMSQGRTVSMAMIRGNIINVKSTLPPLNKNKEFLFLN